MTIVQTVLVFVAIPAGIIALLALGVYGRSELRQPSRYRPGRPWQFAPVWYVPHPENIAAHLPAGTHPQLGSAQQVAVARGDEPVPTPAAVGGASGEW